MTAQLTAFLRLRAAGALVALIVPLVLAWPAAATKIERVVSPSGIEAWLVREPSVPLIAMNFAFRGGASQDPADKPGLANLTSGLLDEGAGDLDGNTYHQRLENHAIELHFNVGRDEFRGSLRTLNEHRD